MILIYLGEYKNKHSQKVKRAFYIFPKKLPDTNRNNIDVIGGIFIEDTTWEIPNKEKFPKMIKYAKFFYGI